MRDLSQSEIANVGGADVLKPVAEYVNDAGKTVGKLWAWGTKMQLHVASLDNPMLGAMALGA
jgi:hypothetical protein